MILIKKENKKLKAITLIEVIIYLGIFASVFTVLIQFAFTTGDFNNRNMISNLIDKQIIFLNQHISESFKSTTAIDETNSTLGVNESKLILTANSQTLEYEIQNNRLVFNRNSQENFISSSKILVSSFLLEPVLNSEDVIVGVNLNLTLVPTDTPDLSRTVTTSYVFK